jgi:bifunctional non-homologous end joining protein LigD
MRYHPAVVSLAAEPPASDHWTHEIKHDGYRTLSLIDNGKVQPLARNRNDWADRYRAIVAAA